MNQLTLQAAHTALFGPLSKVPGPIINKWTTIPLFLAAFQHQKVHYIHALHEKYGKVLLLPRPSIMG